MDSLVRVLVRQIALGGLSGSSIHEIWENFELELNVIKDELLPFNIDNFTKVVLWQEILKLSYITHYKTEDTLPELSIFEHTTMVNEPNNGEEGID